MIGVFLSAMGIRQKKGRFGKTMAARALVTAWQDWVDGVGEQVPQRVNGVSVSSRDGRHGLRRDGGYGWPRLG